MIVDTSAVIEMLRQTGSATHRRLEKALRAREPISIPAVVLQEVLQGARDAVHFARLRAEMDVLPVYEPDDHEELHRHAAILYARCRWQGFTPRSPIDCIVAACALEAGSPLLANDRDFGVLAAVEPRLQLIP